MGEFVPVITLEELPTEGFKAVEINGRQILVGRAGQQVFACVDRCPHAKRPLRTGKLRGQNLQCAWHGWTFDVLTGHSIPDHPTFRLTQVPIKLEGSQVLVSLSAC